VGTLLSIAAYAATAVFIWRVAWRFALWAKGKGPRVSGAGITPASVMSALVDVAFLRRLFLVNKGIWFGEWVFHVSFVLVVMRHLRFFLEPVPAWVVCVQPVGKVAGFLLPASLLYILVYRFALERAKYISAYNLFLTLSLLIVGAAGLLMRTAFPADVIAAKDFVRGWLALAPADAPESGLFMLHFALAALAVAFLPSHIFTAPFTTLEARKREGGLERLVHEKEQ